MVRRGLWRLGVYHGHEPELFNVDEDPGELHDHSADPAVSAVRDALAETVYADGWDPDRVKPTREARQPVRNYLAKWSKASVVPDPWQGERPSPL